MLFQATKFGQVKDAILLDDRGKVDYTVPIADARMSDLGELFNAKLGFKPGGENAFIAPGIHALTPNDHALGQIFTRVGIPAKYGRKVYDENRPMIAEHVNYWIEMDKLPQIESHDSRDWLVRAKGNLARAVLSDKYTQLDNEFAFGALGSVLDEDTAVKINGFNLDDKYLNARMTFPEMRVNLGTLQNPDWVYVGIHFRNSEVGCSSVAIDACLWRQVCSNGLIVKVKDTGLSFLQQRHSRIGQNELQNRVADAISNAVKSGDGAIESFAKSREVKVKSPLDLIAELSKKNKYSQALTDNVKSSFQTEPEPSLYGVVNAFTAAARALPMEQRLEVETFAGQLMQDQH